MLDNRTKSYSPEPSVTGTFMTRGSDRGAWTIALFPARPKASVPSKSTMKARPLFNGSGNGLLGSSPIAVVSGTTSLMKNFLSHDRCFLFQSDCSSIRISCLASLGNNSLFRVL